MGTAPFIRLEVEGQEGGKPALVAEDGRFGLLPHWCAEYQFGRKTYNARSETVASKPAFRDAWKRSQRCIIPAEYIYEPCWETGKAVRWRIYRPGDVPMGIAGLYTQWKNPEGQWLYTFTMLTVNANGHVLMSRMHRPEDEKRMVVILDEHEFGPWLTCSLIEAPRYFRQHPGQLLGFADPPRGRASGSAEPAAPPPPPEPEQGGLF
jgi:putative SOS response-associated peptidase YedK